jgi:lysophospholipase L1-like esterase
MVVSAPQKKTEVVVAKSTRPRHWLKTLVLIVVWQILALLVVELVMSSAGIGEEEIFRLDKEIGFTHIPNKRIYWKQEGPGVLSYFDSDGMREPNLKIAKPAGTYRVAVLGDSLVEGLQSPIEKTFGYRVGQDLSEKLHRPIEVLNFGNSGYSTAQEYLQLKKVWKYSPDLVVLGYSNRDIYENWSPPDETITNVRPYALHLPGSHLIVDNSSVTGWMRSPRAKFLMQIAWIREYSHIWGLVSAAETQFGHDNPIYIAISELCTKPGKTIRAAWIALPKLISEIPQNLLKSISALSVSVSTSPTAHPQKSALSAPGTHPQNVQPSVQTDTSAGSAGQSAITRAPDTIPTLPETKGLATKQRGVFVELLTRTLGSLFAEMKSESTKHGAKFCVVAMPCRAALCPSPGTSGDTFALNYPDEVEVVKKLCLDHSIPIFDSETAMAELTPFMRSGNFYTNHMTPKGHAFMAKALGPFIEKQIQKQPNP